MPVSSKEIEFPIHTSTACQLKWSHSTLFLNIGRTASCHRVSQDNIPNDFDFHNTPEKLEARKMMLEGKRPGRGCEHCFNIEDAGGMSDRMMHLKHPGILAPPELASDPLAVRVTPRILELYLSNFCNLKCVYCHPFFSSSIEAENGKHGKFVDGNVKIPGKTVYSKIGNPLKDKMFAWLDDNIEHLHQLLLLGGEPMIQPETLEMIGLLEKKTLPDLTLVVFSNLTVKSDRFASMMQRLKALKDAQRLEGIRIIGSIDCWGREAEYVRNGLDLDLFRSNIEYILDETDFGLNINSAITPMSITSMGDLAAMINTWNQKRRVYWTFMKVNDRYLNPLMLGPMANDLGLQRAYDVFDPMGDPDLIKTKEYLMGHILEMNKAIPDSEAQKDLCIYLSELDRRRGTDYRNVFPALSEIIDRSTRNI